MVIGLLAGSKINVVLFTLLTISASTFVVSVLLNNKGTFTISTPHEDTINYGLVLSDTASFDRPRSELRAAPVVNMWNITETDLPDNITDVDGDHNGENYLAYTFYVRNTGDKSISYGASVDISEMHLQVDEAMRVKIYVNGTPTVYAKKKSDGSGNPEPGTIPFSAKTRIIRLDEKPLDTGQTDKYTVVVWLEGEDPDCVNDILGGSVKMLMRFSAAVPTDKGTSAANSISADLS